MAPIAEMENAEPVSDFALKRMENIKKMAAARAALQQSANEFNTQVMLENSIRRHTMSPQKFKRERSPLLERKSGRLSGMPAIDYRGLDFDDKNSKRSRLDDDEKLFAKLAPGGKRRRVSTSISRCFPVPLLPPEEVTEEMLRLISYSSTNKVYHSELGKSCHQCRQKTVDTKSVCRSGKCFGVRGQFCGACLKDHYGEDLAEVLKDPVWECPMCRGVCNCSFCRKRMGKAPLGQISELARRKGYKSVHHFLMAHEGPGEEVDDSLLDDDDDDDHQVTTRRKSTKFTNEDENMNEHKPTQNALFIKLPFGTKKGKQAMDNEALREEKEKKKQRKAIKSKEQMEQLVLTLNGSPPVTKSDIQNLKEKLDEELQVDWLSIFDIEDGSFNGFPKRVPSLILTELIEKEDRLKKFSVYAKLQKQTSKLDIFRDSLQEHES